MPHFSFTSGSSAWWTFTFAISVQLQRTDEGEQTPRSTNGPCTAVPAITVAGPESVTESGSCGVLSSQCYSTETTPGPDESHTSELAHTDERSNLFGSLAESLAIAEEAEVPTCSLLKLPAEVRLLIYKELLVTEGWIHDAHLLIGTKGATMEHECPKIESLHCDVLQTCREIYDEALPILYGCNAFWFKKPTHIRTFAHEELPSRGYLTRFGFGYTKYGRLSLMRDVALTIGVTEEYERRNLDRRQIWANWHSFFDPECRIEPSGFPMITNMFLDFRDWKLGPLEIDAIRPKIIKTIVEKLRESGGLTNLAISGMKQEQNLYDLKQGLVRPGGRFQVFGLDQGKHIDVTKD